MTGITESERDRLIERICADPALWRAEAWTAYAQVRDEFERVRGRESEGALKNEIEIVQGGLDAALAAMAPLEFPGASDASRANRKLMRAWNAMKLYYSGADIERTWSAIHRASQSLYMLYDESELPAQASRLHKLVAALPDLSSQLASLTDALTLPDTQAKLAADPKDPKLKTHATRTMRATLRELYQQAMGATESLQTEARVLRNTLLAASGALFLVVFVLGTVHLLNDGTVSLCATANGGGTICPAGGSSHPLDVFAVELAGMLGGILSVVIPLATGDRIKTPYRVFNHQLLLKILAGAAAGLAGVVLVESGLVSAFNVGSGTAIIGYAIFFGFSQQALTGIIDRRASELGKETPTAKSV